MIPPQLIGPILCGVLIYFGGIGIVHGVKKVAHGIVHVFHKPKPPQPPAQPPVDPPKDPEPTK